MTSWVDVAGWTLLHFVWQGACVAGLAAIALRLLRSSPPETRYLVSCAALVLMLSAPALTAWTLSGAPQLAVSSVHVLRSAQGAVVGLAVTPSTLFSNPYGTTTPSAPIEVGFPIALRTGTLLPAIVTAWMTGVVILLARLLAGCWRIRRLRTEAASEPVSRWHLRAEEIADRLHLPRRFSVVDSARVATPTVIGWLRPLILLPVAAMSGLTPRQVDAILAHELAHIRRHDFAINLMQTLTETILFYHPAVWWISARIRCEREQCCDDVAVSVCGDAREYAEALTELASWGVAHSQLAMAATRGSLVTRVRRLLRLDDGESVRGGRLSLAVGVALTVFIGAGVTGAILRAQPLTADSPGPIGPRQINKVLGYSLFPEPVRLPTDDPVGIHAWGVLVPYQDGAVSYIGFGGRGLIRDAYSLGEMPIVGAPEWLDQESLDLTTAPLASKEVASQADTEEVRAAIRATLEGRLHLAAHREWREFPAYALVRVDQDGGIGPNIRPSTGDCFDDAPARENSPPILEPRLRAATSHVSNSCGFDDTMRGMTGRRVTMVEFADAFHRRRDPMAPDREIVDQTGLTGKYDFELQFGFRPLAAIAQDKYKLARLLAPFGFRTLFSALPEQLGLKLIDGVVSHEVLVIDHIERP